MASNEKKRLFLDFTVDIREEAETERMAKQSEEGDNDADEDDHNEVETTNDDSTMSDEEAMWEAYSADDFIDEGDDDDDRDIEDAFGLGSY